MGDTQLQSAAVKLLVVDDDLAARRAMEAFLSLEGYEVRCAPNGQTTLMFSREDPPDLILLDIRLPDEDGFEVCRRLKANRGTREIPVIFISGLEEAVDKVKVFSAGGLDYISKPFHVDEVLARVKTHLEFRRLQGRIEAQNEKLEQEVLKSRQAERALQQAYDEMEARIRERTAALANANRQLHASEEQLQERLKFETLMADISARFVNLPSDRIDGEIGDAQRRVCECLGLGMSVLWQMTSDAPGTIVLTHLYRPLGGPPVPERMEAQSYFPWVLQQLTAGNTLAFSSLEELPAESDRDQEVLRHYGVKSILAMPRGYLS